VEILSLFGHQFSLPVNESLFDQSSVVVFLTHTLKSLMDDPKTIHNDELAKRTNIIGQHFVANILWVLKMLARSALHVGRCVLDKSLLSSQIFITQFKRTPFLYNI
jgi:putative Ca2+/H+ antiporter (TMEM165/GDT1 family)